MPGKLTLIMLLPYRRAKAAYIPCFEATNLMACKGFGNREAGGSRTGSVVAVTVAMSSPPLPVLKMFPYRTQQYR
jgi:hypothetical protein